MTDECTRFEGALALDALGALPDDERPGMRAHLDGCAACREVHRELTETASALALVDDASIAPTASVPPALTERVLGALHHDAQVARRRRHVRVAGVGVLGAIAASVLALLALATAPGVPSGRTEVLHGAGTAARATAVLTSRPWGTSIALTESGLPAGHVYYVSMRTSTGTWWLAGSFGGGPHVVAQLTCDVPANRITAIRVTDESGTAVLESDAPPGVRW